MSFDLALQNGDLVVGTTDLKQVRGNTKLAQDILKVIHTPLGSNPYYPNLGSYLTSADVGELLDKNFVEQRVEAYLLDTLKQVQIEQQKQINRGQVITPSEKLVNVVDVTALIDDLDPRQFNISISVTTGELDKQLDLQFGFSTTID